MNAPIEALNAWADPALRFAWPMLWQSSLLIGLLFVLDLLMSRKLRPAVRYAFWLLVLVKLLLPPSLAFPTGAGWWLRTAKAAPAMPRPTAVVVTYGEYDLPVRPDRGTQVLFAPPRPRLTLAAWGFGGVLSVGLGLLSWMAARWHQVARNAYRAAAAPDRLSQLLPEPQRSVRLKLTDHPQSPAVCGLFRPVILLPRSLAEQLPPAQLRAVLLHVLFHLRRGDVWVNCAQGLLQIVYWWHPLLWFANARIRRVREEAVDDAVMLALDKDAETYAPTLLEVAKLALHRPLASLGLVGILESRSSLRQRIERLVDFRVPRKAGLTFTSICGIFVFSAVALPMGQVSNSAEDRTSPNAQPRILINARVIEAAKESADIAGIISGNRILDPNATGTLLKGLQASPGSQSLGELDVVSLGAQKSVIQLTHKCSIIKGYTCVEESNLTSRIMPQASIIEVGAVLNVEPIVLDNGHIQVTITATNTDFLGYADPSKLEPDYSTNSAGRQIPLAVCLPALQIKNVSAKAVLADGQNLLMIFPKGKPLSPAKPNMERERCVAQHIAEVEEQKGEKITLALITVTRESLLVPSAGDQAATNSPAPPGSTNAALLDQTTKAGRLVRDGKLLYEMGKLDEAGARFKLALKDDPHNRAALYYLNLVSEARFARVGQAHDGIVERWTEPVNRNLLSAPSPSARTNLVQPSQGRRRMLTKLEEIRFDSVSFDGLPLSEVVRRLSEETRKRDPEKRGINFLINQNMVTGLGSTNPLAPTLGPDGQPLPAPQSEQPDIADISIKLYPLTDVRLADVLDAIVKVADRPIKYSIEDHAIVFSLIRPDGISLFIRTFKVDPKTLIASLQLPLADSRNNPFGPINDNEKKRLERVGAALRDYFAKAGVDFDPARNPGKSIFFNDRQGMLIVRATPQDLHVIEAAIQTLNFVPPQINIKSKFVEVSDDDTRAVGLDWYLGNVLTTNTSTGGPGSVFSSTKGQVSTSILPSVGSALSSLSGILTDSQYRMVLKALQQREGTELVASPEVTTHSGRQAQCKVAEVRSVASGIDERALTPPGITSTNDFESSVYSTEQIEFGPTLDIIPEVLPDGYTINLSLVVSLLEFLRYEDSQTNRVTVYVNGKQKEITPPRPIVRTAQVSSQVNVWDGQTLVLWGLVSERTIAMKASVPVLGNLPGVGKLFRSESKSAQKRNLLVFITPTLIDPAGNRVHSEAEMPFARDKTPAQPPR